jgi:hypothetical protein
MFTGLNLTQTQLLSFQIGTNFYKEQTHTHTNSVTDFPLYIVDYILIYMVWDKNSMDCINISLLI